MIVILPFEKEFYKSHNYNVYYEGHPIIDFIDRKQKNIPENQLFIDQNDLDSKQIIAILPGSRNQELKKLLPVMLSVVDDFPDYQFVIAGTSSVDKQIYKDLCGNKRVKVIFDQTYALLKYSYAGIVTSGTATLETAIFDVPQIVCYKTSGFSYFIGRQLVKIKFFSLVNLILDKSVVKELLQDDVTKENINSEMNRIISESEYRKEIKDNYNILREKLGKPGVADRIAVTIINS